MDLRRIAVLALACLALAVAPFSGCRKKGEGLGVELELVEKKLGNGLRVVLVEDHTVPVVSYQTWFRVGSVDERPGITGISHLFEHLMFKGTPRYPAKQFFQQLEAKGAEVNAFTTRDYTVYYENFTPNLLEKVVDMEADRMANLVLDEKTLETERQVVFEERRLRTDNSPQGKMQEALWELAYRRHPYQWPVIGYPQDLLALDVATIREYFKTHYHPGNAVIVVVGDIRPDATYELIRRRYGALISGKAPDRSRIPAEPEQKEERRLTLYDQVASERFAQAYHVTSAHDDDSYAMDVLANILFAGTTSRAYRRLVEEKDILLGVNGSAYTPSYPGLMIISGTMKGTLPSEQAETELEKVIREVQDGGVTAEEVRVAVKQLTVEMVDSVRTPHGLGQLIGTVATIFGDPGRFEDDLAKYTKVAPADVKRVAEKFLIPNNRSVVVLKPESSRPRRKDGGT